HSRALPLFPYTTLFRSCVAVEGADEDVGRLDVAMVDLATMREMESAAHHVQQAARDRNGQRAAGAKNGLQRTTANEIHDEELQTDRKSTRLNSSHVAIS